MMAGEETVKILFVDDEPNVLRSLQRLFLDEDYELLTAASGEEGLAIMASEESVPVVVSDFRMPGMDGVEFLKEVHGRWPRTVRLVLSGYADTAAVVAAINEGQIYRFVAKPWNDDELKLTIAKAVELFFLQEENQRLTMNLRASNQELKALNERLEQLVQERTRELLFQNKVLEHGQFILESLPVGVLGIDPAGTVAQANAMAHKLLGARRGSLTGAVAAAVLPEALAALLADLVPATERRHQVAMAAGPFTVHAAVMTSEEGQAGKILVLVPETAEGQPLPVEQNP